MTPGDIRRGGVYRIGRGCGVPYEWAPLTARIIRVVEAPRNGDNAWLDLYQLDQTGRAFARRTVYVGQVSGMQDLMPQTPADLPQRRRPTNAGPAATPRIPRPRTPSDPITPGRTR
jgi:hypothetical protein